MALDFIVEVFSTYKQEKGLANLITMLKKGGLEGRMMEFMPANKRTEENFRTVFEDKGLHELVKLHKAQASQEAKRDLQRQLQEALSEGKPIKEITTDIRDFAAKNHIPEQDVVAIVRIRRTKCFLNSIFYFYLNVFQFCFAFPDMVDGNGSSRME